MYFDDKDFEQKIRFQKVLWSMGHWARIEIPIVIYEDDNKNEKLKKHYLTDIDVYGEIIQSDFSVIKSIGDCKSGNNVKIFERLFWTRGVKDYMNASNAYLVKKSISNKAKIFMPKLEVKGIDSLSLIEMEKVYHASSLTMFSVEYYTARLNTINQLKDEFKKIYDYLNTRYWFTDLNISMRVIMTMLKKNEFYSFFKKDDKVHKFLIAEICIMLCRTLTDCCRYIMARDVTNIEKALIEYIHGGTDGLSDKIQMIREISVPLQEIYGAKEDLNNVFLKPDYFDDILKLVIILIGEAENTKDIIRYLEIMQHEILLDKKMDYTKIVGLAYSPVSHKISKDIMSFYLRINHIDSKFFDELFL